MPLVPTPQTVVHLEHTLHGIDIARWEDGEQRLVVVEGYDSTGENVPGFEAQDYEHAMQFCSLDELDEIINALLMQRNWLAAVVPLPEKDWVVTIQWLNSETDPQSWGPYTRAEADQKVEDLGRDDAPFESIAVTKLEK